MQELLIVLAYDFKVGKALARGFKGCKRMAHWIRGCRIADHVLQGFQSAGPVVSEFGKVLSQKESSGGGMNKDSSGDGPLGISWTKDDQGF